MTDAYRDSNNVPTLLGTSSDDGTTPVPVQADPTNHGLKIHDASTGSDLSGDVAARDSNFVPVLMCVSSADGVTPVAVYTHGTDGHLLIDSN